jgi:acetyl esterase/lipase
MRRATILLFVLAACIAAQQQKQQRAPQDRKGPNSGHVGGGQPEAAIPENVTYIRDLPYCTGGGHPLLLDWYVPKQPARTPGPVIIWIHGGGWVGSDKSENQVPVFLSRRGLLVASINYRLSNEAIFPAAIEDCKCAIRFVRANAGKYDGDPAKIGLVGSSAGAHLSLLAGMADDSAGLEGSGGLPNVSSRVQAVASLKGVSDFTVGHKAFQHGLGIGPSRFLGGSMEQQPENYKRASPLHWLSKDDPPILLLHGDDDTVVPYDQAVKLKKAYDELGLHAELVPIPGATHQLRRRDGSPAGMSIPQIYDRIYDFFKRMFLDK